MANQGKTLVSAYGGLTHSIRYEFTWIIAEQSSVDNTSTIAWELAAEHVLHPNEYSEPPPEEVSSMLETITINDTNCIPENYVERIRAENGLTVIASGRYIVKHDKYGSGVLRYTVGSRFRSEKASYVLDEILTKAETLNSPNFNDEENATINYALPINKTDTNNISKIEVCISSSFYDVDKIVEYRSVPVKTSYSYTYNFTEEERVALRKAVIIGSSVILYFITKTTMSDGDIRTHYTSGLLTLVNHEPTLEPTVIDVNNRTVALTGNANTFVKYMSNAAFTTGARAYKEAFIDTQYVINGSQTVDGFESGTIEGVDSNTFYYGATDTRGLTARDFIVVDLIPYVKPTCQLTSLNLDKDGKLKFTIKGSYFNGSFGAANNTLQVEYSIRENNGDISWHIFETSPTFKENTYTITHTITGLDYRSKYTITANVIDELTSAQSEPKTATLYPVFDWSETDFNHNTEVTFQEDITIADGKAIKGDNLEIDANTLIINGKQFTGDNKVLWEGALHMNDLQSINLSEAISEQSSGIILVFSLCRNNAAENVSINSFFVSKKEVDLLYNAPHSFFMLINAGFSTIGAKYLYIQDKTIKGHEGNTSSGSNNGISFNNSMFVLRYVIGV